MLFHEVVGKYVTIKTIASIAVADAVLTVVMHGNTVNRFPQLTKNCLLVGKHRKLAD